VYTLIVKGRDTNHEHESDDYAEYTDSAAFGDCRD